MIKELSKIFNVNVYGYKSWKDISCNYIKYKGYAEHFYEMPKYLDVQRLIQTRLWKTKLYKVFVITNETKRKYIFIN
ncbi:hypothetical protein [Clostridium botulinum]|uniref:hypothetical protein n=1 Tax=Clostridium botulinum TaxID=1491 RepID=UPI0007DF6CAA|nr:hypothetical protein [Clostridium botulinum]KEI85541.1 hypothetical protein N491_14575 [Clostridium botulinum B2 275]